MPIFSDTTPEEALEVIEGQKPGSGGSTIGVDNSFQGFGPIHSQGPHPQPAGDGASNNQDQSIIDNLQDLGLTDAQIAALFAGSPGGSGGGSYGGGGSYNPMQGQLESVYFRLWGERAPPNVISQALNAGLNVFQFEDQIRQDPAFRKSETYQNEMADNVLGLARMLGIFPG